MGDTIRVRTAIAGALAAIATAGTLVGGQPAKAATPITWGKCPPLAQGAERDPRQTCGTVEVPLDYRRPGGETIKIAVSRIATAKPGRKRGVLLLNPGGPGLPGLDIPGQMARTLPKSVLDAYDLIGFDPRGIGHSNPMSCGLSGAESLSTLFPYPGPGGAIEPSVAAARKVAEQCAANAPKLRYFTSANTARDIERIRQALGVRKISYWGQSFGTYLGAVYASLYPGHTDRIVLEGNVDPRKIWSGMLDTWNQGMNDRFPDAARIAAADHATLGLGRTAGKVTKTFIALADRLDAKPVTVPGTQVAINGGLLRAVTYQMLLHDETLAPLTRIWKAVSDLSAGKAPSKEGAAALQQALAGTPATPGVPEDNQVTMALAMLCGDTSWSRDVGSYAKAVKAARAKYPLSAGMPGNIRACAFWPEKPIEPTVKVTSQGPRNVLVLQNRRDNATPWAAGKGMRKAFGHRAVLVGADQGGHYVYGTGSSCADRATVAFLAKGELPARDLYCRS